MSRHELDKDQFFNGVLFVPHLVQQLLLPDSELVTISWFAGLICSVLLCALVGELFAQCERTERRQKEFYLDSRRSVYLPQKHVEHISAVNDSD